MADLDSPLKQLVSAFIADFAAWLLHADVREAHALNVELRCDYAVVALPGCAFVGDAGRGTRGCGAPSTPGASRADTY